MAAERSEYGRLLYEVRSTPDSAPWGRLPATSKAYWQEVAERFVALTRDGAALSTPAVKRPTGWRWFAHAFVSGGFCFIACPHYVDYLNDPIPWRRTDV